MSIDRTHPTLARRNTTSCTVSRLAALAVFAFLIGCGSTAAQSFEVTVDFGIPAGREPHGGVVEGRDGCLYGTTVAGGMGHGTVFQWCSGVSTTIFTFDGANTGRYPQAALTVGTDGQLYGTTRLGSASNAGTIFRLDPSTGQLTTLHVFNGANGAESTAELSEGSDGRLYGVTSMGGTANKGTAFSIQKSGAGFTLLKSFTGTNGRGPAGKMVQGSDSFWYGTTAMGGANDMGTIFRMSSSGTLTTLVTFDGTNGAYPYGGLVEASDGYLYGLTGGGGSASQGTAYRVDLAGTLKVLRSFTGSDGSFPYAELIQATDGMFYGTTMYGGGGQGVVFKMTAAGAVTVLRSLTTTDGTGPEGALVQASNGRLYGTTPNSGPAGAAGTIFEVNSSGGFTRLYAFRGEPATPYGPLLARPDGSLYGVSAEGGAMAAGTIFKLVPGVSFDVIHGFNGPLNGSGAYDGLIAGTDGSLYGVAPKGGADAVGTLFKVTSSDTFTLLSSASSTNTNGFYPYGSVVQAADGAFYGVMSAGGAGRAGTIYKMTAAGSVSLAHAFDPSKDGSKPYGRLTSASDGVLYGTTSGGGSAYLGTLFSYDPAAKKFTLRHTFTGGNGGNPFGGLIQGSDGRLYGTTLTGGSNGYGTLFAFDIASGKLTTLHSFKMSDGAYPYGALFEAADGRLYGTTSGGGDSSLGTVFSIAKTGDTYMVMHSFKGADGAAPRGALTQAADSYLYGTTPDGGSTNSGVIFRIAPVDNNPPAPPSSLTATAASQSRVNLAWTINSTNESEFRIERCQSAGCTNFAQIGTVPAATATYADTTVVAATTYQYRVRAANAAGASAYSNTASATTPASSGTITVTAPNTAISVTEGVTLAIKWSHDLGAGSLVRVHVSRDAGATWNLIADSVANSGATTGSYDWVASGPTTQARIRVSAVSGNANDMSDVNFTIAAPAITVTVPNTAVNWGVGSTQRIKWKHNRGTGSTVRIQVSRDGGTSWSDVISSVANNAATTGSYDWVVTSPTTGRARIRVMFTDGAAPDTSNVDFTIAAPFVRVTSPNLSSVILYSGTDASIKWTSNVGALEKVKIELSLDGGGTYPVVMVASTPSDGAQIVSILSSWVTPTARVRVTWLKNTTIADASDQAFAIR